MPRKPVPGDRERIEAELGLDPILLQALERLRELHNVDDWTRTPFYQPFASAACVQLTGRLIAQGMASESAWREAAFQLGIKAETFRSWTTRWEVDSRPHVHVAPSRPARGPARLGWDEANTNEAAA